MTHTNTQLLKAFKVCMTSALLAILFSFLYIGIANASDQKTIAMVIAAEGCGENSTGLYAIASVIMNRSIQWHKTPLQIVTSKNAFYGLNAINRHRLYRQCESDSNKLAALVLDGSLDDITNGALYFRQPREPIYSWHKVKVWEWKGHVFYR